MGVMAIAECRLDAAAPAARRRMAVRQLGGGNLPTHTGRNS